MGIMTLNDLIGQFGSNAAKDNFRKLCKEYYSERVQWEALDQAGEGHGSSRRAEVHSQIMAIVQKLFLHSGKIMPSRKEVGEMIMRTFREDEE